MNYSEFRDTFTGLQPEIVAGIMKQIDAFGFDTSFSNKNEWLDGCMINKLIDKGFVESSDGMNYCFHPVVKHWLSFIEVKKMLKKYHDFRTAKNSLLIETCNQMNRILIVEFDKQGQ